jgi:4-methyl-5(b-hydroxyethyl)-thiazole monophosphate biosynthesis
MNPVLIPLANGFEEIEAISIVDTLRRAGVEAVTVSIDDSLDVKGSHGITIKADGKLSHWDSCRLAGIICPGGLPGTDLLAEHQPLLDLIKKIDEQKKLLAAICAAPRVLAVAGVLEGRQVTCYPGVEVHLHMAKVLDQGVVKDGHLMTGRAVGASLDFALTIVRHLKGEAAYLKQQKSMMMR